jgi:hypothetical protein
MHFATLRPEEREGHVRLCVSAALRELDPDVALLWVSVVPRSSLRGRRLGYLVGIVCDLPLRHSDFDPGDPETLATFAESQVTTSLVPLCNRLGLALLRTEYTVRGDVSCIAHLWVPAASRQRSGRIFSDGRRRRRGGH